MAVKRIVTNINTSQIHLAKQFYGDILGLHELMNHGWIATYGNNSGTQVQISFASEGGSGTQTPDISIEVDNIEEVYHKMKASGFAIDYEITDEPWGVRRFFVRDPFYKLVNILAHI